MNKQLSNYEKKNLSLIFILVIFVISFFIRLGIYIFLVNRSGISLSQSLGYYDEALNIVKGNEWFMGYWNNNYQLLTTHPKGFTVLLALCMKICSSDPLLLMHIINSFVDSFVCIFIYWLSKDLFKNPSIGVVGAVIWAINPLAIINATQDIADSFSCFFVALILWLYYKPFQNQYLKFGIIGCAMGIAHYFRSEFLFILIIISIAELIRTFSIKKIYKPLLLMTCTFLFVNSPWMAYTYQKTGHIIMSSTTGWGSMYESLGEKEDNHWGIVVNDSIMDKEAISLGYDSAWSYDANQYYKSKTLEYITSYPLDYLSLVVSYRFPKAFFPGSFVLFNMNYNYDGSFSIKSSCSAFTEGSNFICTNVFKQLVLFENSASKYSLLFFIFICIFILINRKNLRKYIFIIFLYGYFPVLISLLKKIEPRNVEANLPVLTLTASYVLVNLFLYIKKKTSLFRNCQK